MIDDLARQERVAIMIYDGGLSVEEAERLADGCVAGDGELKQVELFSADVVRAKIRGLWKDY